MKIRFLLVFTAWFLTLTLLAFNADARTVTFKAKRCGVATVDSSDLSDDPGVTIHSFTERGKLTSATTAPLPGLWNNIQYICYGYVIKIQLMNGLSAKKSAGICKFKDTQGNSTLAEMSSTNNKVEFKFFNGTGTWSGVTGNGKGSGEMPFAGGGTAEQCSSLITFTIKTP
jgi:hypothetical protein